MVTLEIDIDVPISEASANVQKLPTEAEDDIVYSALKLLSSSARQAEVLPLGTKVVIQTTKAASATYRDKISYAHIEVYLLAVYWSRT